MGNGEHPHPQSVWVLCTCRCIFWCFRHKFMWVFFFLRKTCAEPEARLRSRGLSFGAVLGWSNFSPSCPQIRMSALGLRSLSWCFLFSKKPPPRGWRVFLGCVLCALSPATKTTPCSRSL